MIVYTVEAIIYRFAPKHFVSLLPFKIMYTLQLIACTYVYSPTPTLALFYWLQVL